MLVVLLIFSLNVCLGLSRHRDKREAMSNDFIVQNIKEQLGSKASFDKMSFNYIETANIYYEDNTAFTQEGRYPYTRYEFIIAHNKKSLIADMVNTINDVLQKQEENGDIEAINIILMEKHPCTYVTVASFTNYTKNESESTSETDLYDLYPRLVSFDFLGNHLDPDSIYNEFSVYSSIKDVMFLDLSSEIVKHLNLDNDYWYEVWPDLEQFSLDGSIDIQKPNDSFSKAIKDRLNNKIDYLGKNDHDTHINYQFLIMDFGKELITDVTDTINEILAENRGKRLDRIKVCLCVQTETDDSHHTTPLAILSNFTYDLRSGYSKGNSQLTDIEILDVTNKSSTHVLNSSEIAEIYYNADSYVNLKGIKYFTVNEALDENAKAEGIDWYEV